MTSPPPAPSLREKIGQMINVGFRGAHPAECALVVRDISEHQVGGIIFFDQDMANPASSRRNIESPAQTRELVRFLQSHAEIPLLVSIDQEGGRVNRLKEDSGFPASISHEELGRLNDERETSRRAAVMAANLASLGFNLNLAPVVDLDANPDNPIIRGKGRSFSSDPEKVARHAAAFVRAHHDAGVLTCAKHFPGHGSAAGDTHLGWVDVTPRWTEQELVPFQRLIESGLCDMVMTAHVFNARLDPALPATLSRAVVTGLLRERLGFQGVITSDDLEMKAISTHYGLEKSIPLAVEAGVDWLCFGNNLNYDADIAPKAIDILWRAVKSGRIPETRIDESHVRIMRLKQGIRK